MEVNFNVNGLKRWRDSICQTQICTKEDIKNSIVKIKNLQKKEKYPPKIDFKDGWSPYTVMRYLEDYDLKTGHYFNFEKDWYANSNYLKLDDNILANNVAYYISGDENRANSLKLVLNVNNSEFKDTAYDKFILCIRILHIKSLEKKLPSSIEKAILNGRNFYSKSNFIEIFLKKENWNNGKNGHHISFEIKHSG